MERWQSLIDQQINKALGDVEASKLPGAGKPLNLDTDPNTPAELQMAFKILRDNNIEPDWIMQARELDAKREQLVSALRRAAQAYHSALKIALPGESAWRSAQHKFRAEAEAYNKQVITHNLKLPPGIDHRFPLNIEREIERAQQA